MTPLDGKYFQQINSLKEKLDLLNEPYILHPEKNGTDFPHSEQWISIFNELINITEEYSNCRWPYFKSEFLKKTYNVQYINSSFTYEKCIITILKNYNPKKLDKGGKPVTFWHYYTYVLSRELSKRASAAKLQYLNSNTIRVAKIPVRTQRKINRMIRIVKIWNSHHQNEEPLTIESELAKQLFLQEENLFDSEDELNKVLKLNNVLYIGKKETKQTWDYGAEEITSKTENFTHNDIVEIVSDFFTFLGKCFRKKMDLKHDKSQDERKKFSKQIFTLYFLTKITKLTENITTVEVIDIFRKKAPDVFDSQIAREVLEKEKYITQIGSCKTNKQSQTVSLKILERRMKPTLESVSEANGKNKNYGIRRVKDFKDFCQSEIETLNDKNTKKNYTYFLN